MLVIENEKQASRIWRAGQVADIKLHASILGLAFVIFCPAVIAAGPLILQDREMAGLGLIFIACCLFWWLLRSARMPWARSFELWRCQIQHSNAAINYWNFRRMVGLA
ncbi:hypothetical protein MTBLM1_10310 [Rhodospirillaceae bacterium LM-1]|nr:hypothetical protein MTBLM1_10310 [Rhodospirillaceae bacterium LM-1]